MERRFPKALAAAGLTGLLLLGLTALPAADDPPRFSDWSAPVNLGPVVNSTSYDACPTISKDGLSLYFRSNRPGSYYLPSPPALPNSPSFDIWVSRRDSLEDPWQTPTNLGPEINTPYHEYCTAFSPDGHYMVFVSQRPMEAGGCTIATPSAPYGNQDLWISHRKDKRNDLGWTTPLNLGCSTVNSTVAENGPAWFEDEATGRALLYLSSNRSGGIGYLDIYISEEVGEEKGNFGSPSPVTELNTKGLDYQPVLRKDGLEIFFASNRPSNTANYGLVDLWTSTRDSTLDSWSSPVSLGSVVNSTASDFHPTLSRDGTVLIFASERVPGSVGSADLWMVTRSKLRGPH